MTNAQCPIADWSSVIGDCPSVRFAGDAGLLVGEGMVKPVEWETVPRTIGRYGVDFLMTADGGVTPIDLADPLPQITDQLVDRFILRPGGQVAIEIADQADADRDVVEVVAVHMPPGNLVNPAIADLDLAVAGGAAVANHKMICEPIGHVTDMTMVIVEDSRIALPSAAIVNNDVFPAVAGDPGIVDCLAHRRG